MAVFCFFFGGGVMGLKKSFLLLLAVYRSGSKKRWRYGNFSINKNRVLNEKWLEFTHLTMWVMFPHRFFRTGSTSSCSCPRKRCQGAAKMFMGKRRVFNKPKTKTACSLAEKSLLDDVSVTLRSWVNELTAGVKSWWHRTSSLDWWLISLVDIVDAPKSSKTYVYAKSSTGDP